MSSTSINESCDEVCWSNLLKITGRCVGSRATREKYVLGAHMTSSGCSLKKKKGASCDLSTFLNCHTRKVNSRPTNESVSVSQRTIHKSCAKALSTEMVHDSKTNDHQTISSSKGTLVMLNSLE
jgi:hypothetical protein